MHVIFFMTFERLFCLMWLNRYRRAMLTKVSKKTFTISKGSCCLTTFILFLIPIVIFQRNIGTIIKTINFFNKEQRVIDYIAKNVKVTVKAGDNNVTARSLQITLTNTGKEDILFGHWKIYFYSLLRTTTNKTAGFRVDWINGGLAFLSPIKGQFEKLCAGSSLNLVLEGFKSSSRYDHFPNWYVASNAYGVSTPRIIESTKDESLSYVSSFENVIQWKRHETDMYNPYSPGERYAMNEANKHANAKSRIHVIPTPLVVQINSTETIDFDKTWVVVKQISSNSENAPITHKLALNLGLNEVPKHDENGKYIQFITDASFLKEQYELKVNIKTKSILITSNNGSGAFYGVQTLISMLEYSSTLPDVIIKDHPRFSYRGVLIDVTRNFQSKETIKKFIDVIAQYKINKLHMHLTDNDGWRIEIPSIPELTKYGSRRCHYFENEKCLMPNMGSGPSFESTQGSGFYTVGDFREILQYAKERFVEVIPEIDVPGHALSAIKSMQFRQRDIQKSKSAVTKTPYILSDDVSDIQAIQGWYGSSINPCLNSSYSFVETVLTDLRMIYQGVQKLDLVHIGGDEVPPGVWESSGSCRSMYQGSSIDHDVLKRLFVTKISKIANRLGLKISAWEDGMYDSTNARPFPMNYFKQNEIYVNAWNNNWQALLGGRAIEFADAGYKVILSMATHLYFDHPYEPDPEERGLYWATRYIDTYKVFGFMPKDVYANADCDSYGNKIEINEVCGGPCPHTKAPNNYIGMEACVWSETIRNEEQLFSMTFPRLLAFAERAWHEAEWENLKIPEERQEAKRMDFNMFVDILGQTALPRLEKANVSYRIPPPGVSFSEEKRIAKVNNFYSGHNVMMSLGNDSNWIRVDRNIQIPIGVSDIHVKTESPFLNRKSRTISLHISSGAGYSCASYMYTFVLILMRYIIKNS